MSSRAAFLAATLLAALFLCGCGKSAPTRFYTLSAQAAERPDGASPDGNCHSLGVGPVDFPAYLDRNQIVTQSGGNQMAVADFNQWVEPLQDNFKRTLIADLAGVTCGKPLVLYPWPAGIAPDYQLSIQVRRFDGALGLEAVLAADWTVLDASGRVVSWQTTRLAESVPGPDYAQLAAAQSKLVERFALEVAAKLRGLGR
jgi:uncharacterized protein